MQPQGMESPYPVWKLKLHTIRTDLKPWYWVDRDGFDNATNQITDQPCLEFVCGDCGRFSPKAFSNAPWVCLREDCKEFFIVDGKALSQTGDDGKDLRYTRGFLKKAESFNREMKDLPDEIHQMFQPSSALKSADGETLFGTEKELRGGFTCPTCRCCNAHIFWDRNDCINCGFTQDITPLPYPMDLIESETEKDIKKKQKDGKLLDGATIRLMTSHVTKFMEPADARTELLIVYMIKSTEDKLIGTVVLERPTKASKMAPCGADKLFGSIQEEGGKMKFRRNPARCPGSEYSNSTTS